MDIVERVQQTGGHEDDQGEHHSCEDRPKDMGPFNLKKKFREDCLNVSKYLKGGFKEDRARLFPVVLSINTRGSGQKNWNTAHFI